jgi:hypothetical protein
MTSQSKGMHELNYRGQSEEGGADTLRIFYERQKKERFDTIKSEYGKITNAFRIFKTKGNSILNERLNIIEEHLREESSKGLDHYSIKQVEQESAEVSERIKASVALAKEWGEKENVKIIEKRIAIYNAQIEFLSDSCTEYNKGVDEYINKHGICDLAYITNPIILRNNMYPNETEYIYKIPELNL